VRSSELIRAVRRTLAVVIAGALLFSGTCKKPTPEPPIAEFSAAPVSGEAPLSVQFTDTSTPGTSPIASWSWDFGDGQTSFDQHPLHIYTEVGTYTVSLSVTSDVGTNALTKVDYITTIDSGCIVEHAWTAFPLDGVTVQLFDGVEAMPMPVMVETDCPEDATSVSVSLDGAGLGEATAQPFAVAVPDLRTLAWDAHSIDLAAFGARRPGTAVTAVSAFTLAQADAGDDADLNGIPDDPFAVTASEGNVCLAGVLVADTGAVRMVGATAWYGTDSAGDAEVLLVVADPAAPERRISVTAPKALLAPGEQGVVLLTTADDLDTLLGASEAALLGRAPVEPLAEGARYIEASILVTADGGATFTEMDPARLAEHPVRLRWDGVGFADGAAVYVFAHETVVDSDAATGPFVVAGDGFWSSRPVLDVVAGNDYAEARVIGLSVLALHQAPPGAVDYVYDDFNDGTLDAARWDTTGDVPSEYSGRLDFTVDEATRTLRAVEGGYRVVEATVQLASYSGETGWHLDAQWFSAAGETAVARIGFHTDGAGPCVRAEIATEVTETVLWRRDAPFTRGNAYAALGVGFDSITGLVEFTCDNTLLGSYHAEGTALLTADQFGLFSMDSYAATESSATYFADEVEAQRHYAALNPTPAEVYVQAGAAGPFYGTAGSPYASIQSALTLVEDGGVIHVAPGVYAENVLVSGALSWPALMQISVIGDTDAVIDGGGAGAGLYVEALSAVSIGRLAVRHADIGVFIADTVGDALIEAVSATENDLAGIEAQNARLTARGCVLSHNPGQGIHAHGDADDAILVERCYAQGNGDCGVVAAGASLTLRDCVVTGNGGDAGVVASGPCALLNNTVSDNTEGAGILLEAGVGASASVYNNIVSGNAGVGIDATPLAGGLDINHNNAWNNAGGAYANVANPGDHALAEDPAFVGGGDYHIGTTSVCIGAGDNAYATGDRRDIDGEPRIQRDTVDLGADETPWAPVTVVVFADAKLEAAVREAIAKPDGPILSSDLVGGALTVLRPNNQHITDLTGLEYCLELTTLELALNDIEDLSPIAGLTALRRLRLGGNRITDISALAGLTALNHLELDNNTIADISPLAGLTELRELLLNDNRIVDVTPLAELILFRQLDLDDNLIEDVQALADNEGIGEGFLGPDVLDLSGNPLSQTALCDQIPIIESRGASVDYDGACEATEGEGEGEEAVWAWGRNADGQIGDGTTVTRKAPVQVSGLTDATECAAGADHSLAILANQTIRAWGNNANGQLGDNTSSRRTTPVAVLNVGLAKAIAAGDSHSLAVRTDGAVYAWGRNAKGQIGDGTTVTRKAPVQVSGISGVSAVAAGAAHSLALKSDGTIWAWGDNANGQLGDGSTVQRTAPVQVSGLTGAKAIAAGGDHSLAVCTDGSVWAWGLNRQGQLGDGTTVGRAAPVRLSGLTGVVQVAAGDEFSLARTSSGSVWAWGLNSRGQLGVGNTVTYKTPTRLTGITAVSWIAAGGTHAIAAKSDGTVWAWGDNASGQLGDGTTTRRTSPTLVTGLAGTSRVAAGGDHSVAIAH